MKARSTKAQTNRAKKRFTQARAIGDCFIPASGARRPRFVYDFMGSWVLKDLGFMAPYIPSSPSGSFRFPAY